ncbi:MAG: 16S rRNA (guanine(527)-N(7))-methyltransferase RsmG [Treponema sp.]|jgi:16S rRNA (guanine527-N7)-methyltransferase|nr:16S rRNA (guanine(527)-N(7))-methyltransferase RsmG [Treponema sp.]
MRSILIDGINILCKNNKDVGNIINPRKEEIISLLERYIKEIETFNDAYGLVKVGSRDELIIRHILDSLAPVGFISRLLKQIDTADKNNCKIADAGSGAGFPGIPLAIVLPGCEFTLIERRERRAGFLCSAAAILGLSNITIEKKEIEHINSELFDLVTFRAFTALEPKILKTLFRICKKTGLIAAYKGQREKIEQEIAFIKEYCCQKEIILYKSPFLKEQRHLVVLKADIKS